MLSFKFQAAGAKPYVIRGGFEIVAIPKDTKEVLGDQGLKLGAHAYFESGINEDTARPVSDPMADDAKITDPNDTLLISSLRDLAENVVVSGCRCLDLGEDDADRRG